MLFRFCTLIWLTVLISSCAGYTSLYESGDLHTQNKTTNYLSFSGQHSDSDPDEQSKLKLSDEIYHIIEIESQSNDPCENELMELRKRVLALENPKLSWSHTGTYLVTGFCMLIASSLEAFEVCPNLASFLFIFSGVIFTLRGMQMVYKNCTSNNQNAHRCGLNH